MCITVCFTELRFLDVKILVSNKFPNVVLIYTFLETQSSVQKNPGIEWIFTASYYRHLSADIKIKYNINTIFVSL